MITNQPSRDGAADELRGLATMAAPTVRAEASLACVVLERAARRRRHIRRMRRIGAGVGIGLVALTTLPAATLLGRSDYFTVTQPTSAMESTVHIGDRVVFNRELPPVRGDLVRVHVVNQSDDFDGILRVVAIAGDSVGCPPGPSGDCVAVTVNGTPLPEPYLGTTSTAPFPTATVPADQLYLLGDNRSVAVDSRLFGPVGAADVAGVAVAIVDPAGQTRTVPGAPHHDRPGNSVNVDPAQPVPPAGEAVPR